jgi:hypothetical protein
MRMTRDNIVGVAPALLGSWKIIPSHQALSIHLEPIKLHLADHPCGYDLTSEGREGRV